MARHCCPCRVLLLTILLITVEAIENCDQECENAVQFSNLGFYSTRGVILSGMCFDPKEAQPPLGDVQVQKFPAKSLWFGFYLVDLIGSALSPLFLVHGHNLNCTEYEIAQVENNKISLSLRHVSNDKLSYRFEFNQSGWIEYGGNRYGCPAQVNGTRIIDTDYATFVLIYGCAEASYQNGHHLSGFLLLGNSIHISDSVWNRLEAFFSNMSEYDKQKYKLPERSTLLNSRETGECHDAVSSKPLPVLCNKQTIRNMVEVEKVVVKELRKLQKDRVKEQEEIKKKEVLARFENHEIPYDEISCLVSMFVAVTFGLYWTHFSL